MNDAPDVFSFECQPFSAAHRTILPALFERAASSCYCEWWHFEGDKNAWLERLAHFPEMNRERLVRRAEAEGLGGIVAVSLAGDAIGWMKLTPASAVPKLYAQRLYRGLPCFREHREATLTIGCFLVDPAWRKRDVSGALLASGIELARAAGALAIEAFPRRGDGLRDEEVWTGPYGLYAKHGFEVVHELAQYPVLRRML